MAEPRTRTNLEEEEKGAAGSEAPTTSSFNMLASQRGRLWADIFAPKHSKQLVGNSVNIKRFREWLLSWNSELRKELQRAASGQKKKKRRPKVSDGS